MKLAVVGAGINGIMSAWALREDGHEVFIFERGLPMDATSRASTKLLHGGLRYLEHGDIGLVLEGLRARGWWLREAPALARPLEILVPVYENSVRGRWTLKTGLTLYELLAGRSSPGRHRWIKPQALREYAPRLQSGRLVGAYAFFDGQMDDHALGMWALDRVCGMGAHFRQCTPVERIATDGTLDSSRGRERFDGIVNASGPWSAALLESSNVIAKHRLDLVRGSHLLVARRHDSGFLLESVDDGRVCFVLPYGEHTMIGTTEVRQGLDEPIECSLAERDYLLRLYNAYFEPALPVDAVISTFSGLRPLVAARSRNVSAVSRESVIEVQGRIVTIFGGKWTTSRELGQEVARRVRTWAG